MEETYYLRQPKKKRQRRTTARQSQPTNLSVPDFQKQYGGDKLELVASDGEVRSINLSDFSFQ